MDKEWDATYFEHWWPVGPPVWQDSSKPGRQLIDYLEPKIHSTLKQHNWKRIVIKGLYRRDSKNIITLSEKRDRGFNWQRPTAEILGEEVIQLNCFPTVNYVKHYTRLVTTYLSLISSPYDRTTPNVDVHVSKRDAVGREAVSRVYKYLHDRTASTVEMHVPERDAMSDVFRHSNLGEIGRADIVIVGYLDACPTELLVRNQAFIEARIYQEGRMFSWHKRKTARGCVVAYLGCAVALWGDSIGYLTEFLQSHCETKCVLYVGRVGCLDLDLAPNECLATGSQYHVDRQVFNCRNVLSQWTEESALVQYGSLVTVPSPLYEDLTWFLQWKNQSRWVDCETAYIARSALDKDIDFGYLHIVSDNLGHQYTDNLANEDEGFVQKKRAVLFKEIDRILEAFLDDYGCGTEQRISQQNDGIA